MVQCLISVHEHSYRMLLWKSARDGMLGLRVSRVRH